MRENSPCWPPIPPPPVARYRCTHYNTQVPGPFCNGAMPADTLGEPQDLEVPLHLAARTMSRSKSLHVGRITTGPSSWSTSSVRLARLLNIAGP